MCHGSYNTQTLQRGDEQPHLVLEEGLFLHEGPRTVLPEDLQTDRAEERRPPEHPTRQHGLVERESHLVPHPPQVGRGHHAGRSTEQVTPVQLPADQRVAVLRVYLRRWGWEVGRFVEGLTGTSTDAELAEAALGIPVFRLTSRD